MSVHQNWGRTFDEWVEVLDGMRREQEAELDVSLPSHFPDATAYQLSILKQLCLKHRMTPTLLKSTLYTLKGVV